MPTRTPVLSLLARRVTSVVEPSAPGGTPRVTPSEGIESVPPAGPRVACVRRPLEPHPVAQPIASPLTSAVARRTRDSAFMDPPVGAVGASLWRQLRGGEVLRHRARRGQRG